MLARDVMTTNVSVVRHNSTSAEVARLLLATNASAVPVVDDAGVAVGVVSEWDLVGQHASDRIAKREKWLSRLAEGQPLSADFLQAVDPLNRKAGDLMHRPLISVAETTPVAEVARLIAEHRIKRIFVTRDDRLVGVVSRIDLVRAHLLAAEPQDSRPQRTPVEVEATDRAPADAQPSPAAPDSVVAEIAGAPSALEFRRLVAAAEAAEIAQRASAARLAGQARRELVAALAGKTLGDDGWKALMANARAAAIRGAHDCLLLRFPSELCSDRGRAINAPDPKWPETLRGEAADVFERWRTELQPQGFGLSAQILDFPGGFPGDAGLTLRWGR